MLCLDFDNDGIRDLIKLEVQGSFEYAFTWYRAERLNAELGITSDGLFNNANLAGEVRERGLDVAKAAARTLPVEIILAGQTRRGPLLLLANSIEMRESTEFLVSGSSVESVINWFKFRQQTNAMSVQRSSFHMIEAKDSDSRN